MMTIEKKSLKVGKYVDTAHVDTVIRNYKRERWVHNTERLGKEDSLSAWYSIEELEEFISKIKQHGADGIKLYYGAYSHDFAEKPEYAGLQTIVMVATKSKEASNGQTANKDIYVTTAQGNTSILAYNMSRICPPACHASEEEYDWSGVGVTIIDRGEKGSIVI